MSDLLARLLAAGTDPALVAEVAREMGRLEGMVEAAREPDRAAENRRAYDRERKRAAKAANSTGVPPESVENAESVEGDPSLDKSPHTPKINPTPGVGVGDALARKGKFPCPEGCDPDDWRDILANRKTKRLAMTPASYRKLLRDLAEQADEEWPPGRILRHAAERGWAAIFDPRSSQGTPSNGRPQPNLRPGDNPLRGQRPDPALDLLRASQAAQRVAGSGGDHWEARAALPPF